MVVIISRQRTGLTGSPFKHVRREGTVVEEDFCQSDACLLPFCQSDDFCLDDSCQSVCGHVFSIDPALKCLIHERCFQS